MTIEDFFSFLKLGWKSDVIFENHNGARVIGFWNDKDKDIWDIECGEIRKIDTVTVDEIQADGNYQHVLDCIKKQEQWDKWGATLDEEVEIYECVWRNETVRIYVPDDWI